jgi:hypothetical protein
MQTTKCDSCSQTVQFSGAYPSVCPYCTSKMSALRRDANFLMLLIKLGFYLTVILLIYEAFMWFFNGVVSVFTSIGSFFGSLVWWEWGLGLAVVVGVLYFIGTKVKD